MSLNLDDLIAELPELAPPKGLKQDVLARVQAEMLQSEELHLSAGRHRSWLYPVLAIAAAMLLMFNLPSDEIPGPGKSTPPTFDSTETSAAVENSGITARGTDARRASNPAMATPDESIVPLGHVEQMVQKGAGEVVPRVELKMSVETIDGRARLDSTRSYSAGNRIYFRAWVDSPASLALIRLSNSDLQTLKVQKVDAGEHDLMWNASEPLAWEIEKNETTATYVLLAKAQEAVTDSENWSSLVDGMDWTYDEEHPIGICRSISAPDVGCTAVNVRVTP